MKSEHLNYTYSTTILPEFSSSIATVNMQAEL